MIVKYPKRIMITVAAVLIIVLVIIGFPVIRGNTEAQFASIEQKDLASPQSVYLYGEPYHEIIVLYRYFDKLKAAVYSDSGKPLISDDDFARIDPEAVKKQFGAIGVIKNGPRFYVVDNITGYRMGSEVTIDGHPMIQPGILNLTLMDLLQNRPYIGRHVNRRTAFFIGKGHKVYELVNPQGEVFTMQAASRQVDPDLDFNSLDNLGTRLRPPTGWQYRVRVLSSDAEYYIPDTATVLQDELMNTYQRNPDQ